jgi:hypothetical protein
MQTRIQTAALLSGILFMMMPAAQAPEVVIPLSAEPHHHLALHNNYVNVYRVEVSPHDSVVLHRHDADAISVMLSDAEVTVRGPGKPDVRQKLSKGQIRLQASGYVHSTTIESDEPYRNVTVELLLPQTGHENLCAVVAAAKPLHCSDEQKTVSGAGYKVEPQFQTDQTRLTISRMGPHEVLTLDRTEKPELIIAMDVGIRAGEKGNAMQAGEFTWREGGSLRETFTNTTGREVALISFVFSPQ